VYWYRLAMLAMGGAFFLNGCDTETRAAVEDGIINVSSGFLTALMQAIIGLVGEQSASAAPVIADSVARIFA
jgi:hypothetical protein